MGMLPELEEFRIETFWKDEKTADAYVGKKEVEVKRYILHPAKQLFHADRITRFEFGDIILRSRCFDYNRPDRKEYLEYLGLTEYNVYEICRRTHGMMVQDFIWMRFDGEDFTWEDVKRLKK